jgi:hypothetical protein
MAAQATKATNQTPKRKQDDNDESEPQNLVRNNVFTLFPLTDCLIYLGTAASFIRRTLFQFADFLAFP